MYIYCGKVICLCVSEFVMICEFHQDQELVCKGIVLVKDESRQYSSLFIAYCGVIGTV